MEVVLDSPFWCLLPGRVAQLEVGVLQEGMKTDILCH